MKNEEKLLITLEELVKPEYTALVVIDMQNDFCHREGFFGKKVSQARGKKHKPADLSLTEDMIPNLLNLIATARSVGVKIYFVRSFHDNHYLPPMFRLRKKRVGIEGIICPEGKWGSEQIEGFEPEPDDTMITKYVHSSFIGTDLDHVLKKDGIKSLIITGVNTDVCCESTVRDGSMLGFYIIIPGDCMAAFTTEKHEGALTRMDWLWAVVTTSQEIIETWKI